jgi:hypothetical protein
VSAPQATTPYGVPWPFLIVKLGRKRFWGSLDQPLDERLAAAADKIFPSTDRPFSMYRVRSEEDVYRVAVAMNAGRSSLSEDSSFVAFLDEELVQLGITCLDTPGSTACELVNRWHKDADANPSQALDLCRLAMQQGRPVRTLTKGMLRPAVARSTENRCRAAVSDAGKCLDPECAPANS